MIESPALFVLTGPGRILGVDAWLGPRLDRAGAGGHPAARLLRWLT